MEIQMEKEFALVNNSLNIYFFIKKVLPFHDEFIDVLKSCIDWLWKG